MAGEQLTFFLVGAIAIAQALVVPDPLAVGPGTYPKQCGHVCKVRCPQGFVLDRNGCPTCQCRDRAYVQCPAVACYNQCPNGYIYKNGCQTCECDIVDVCQDQCQRYCQGPRTGLPPYGCACSCQDYVRPAY